MSVIDQMSRLVLADPNVTARQIAKSLGYAEEKSVYYWLSKSGYSGMKDFKRSVLKRTLPASRRADLPVARDNSEDILPLYSDVQQKALGVDLQGHLLEHLGSESYCVLLTEDGSEPLASLGDLLLVDPGAPSFQGDLQWASVRGRMRLVRQYGVSGDSLFYVDAAQPGSLVSPDFVIGKVVFILRKYS